MRMEIWTNNPSVRDECKTFTEVRYFDLPMLGFLQQVRNRVHEGYRLLTHPLSGSVKPSETPYKSVLMTAEPGPAVDAMSLDLIENALATVQKFYERHVPRAEDLPERIRADFALVDLTLIQSAFPSAQNDLG